MIEDFDEARTMLGALQVSCLSFIPIPCNDSSDPHFTDEEAGTWTREVILQVWESSQALFACIILSCLSLSCVLQPVFEPLRAGVFSFFKWDVGGQNPFLWPRLAQ